LIAPTHSNRFRPLIPTEGAHLFQPVPAIFAAGFGQGSGGGAGIIHHPLAMVAFSFFTNQEVHHAGEETVHA
jgi:hypothetical protein